jgi:RNA polymerase sigma-70 factor (ECF subfamily)
MDIHYRNLSYGSAQAVKTNHPLSQMCQPADQELLQRVKSGDRQAFRQLFDTYFAILFRNIDRKCLDPSLAEDIAQETFFRVWKKRHTLKPKKPFFPFIALIAKNLLLDHYKRERTKSKYQDRLVHTTEKRMSTPEDNLSASDLAQKILAFVNDNLSETNQLVFFLSRSEGLSNAEVAEYLGIPKKAVENHLYIALRKIKEEMSCF